MERIINSRTLRIAFDVFVGISLLLIAVLVLSAHFDSAIIVLSCILITMTTALVVRQDCQIYKSCREERA